MSIEMIEISKEEIVHIVAKHFGVPDQFVNIIIDPDEKKIKKAMIKKWTPDWRSDFMAKFTRKE